LSICKKILDLSIIATLSIITFMLCFNLLNSEAASAYIYGPNEKPYNKTYGEYAQMHWNAFANLEPIHAAASSSYQHQKCFFMKIDNKIFLQDFFSEGKKIRSFECTIPQLPIVIPALTESCNYGQFKPSERTDENLYKCAAQAHNPYALVKVTIDGEIVKNINDYRKTSDYFLLNITNPNNWFGDKVGSWRALIDAIMLVVDLPVGEHDIRYEVTQLVPESVMPNDIPVITDVRYHLIVESNQTTIK
jgi:hypothetical protein